VKPSQFEISQPTPMTFELVAGAVSANSWTDPLCCPYCRVPLNLHQPDEEQPSQLLGTCDCCSRWFFLVESELDWEGTLLCELPSADRVRAMLVGPMRTN
jgi:hypothetical protein